MEAITITFPAIPAQEIAALTETEQILATTETEFVSAVREKYALLARLNGNIRTSTYTIGNQNWHESGDTHLRLDDNLVKGLLAADYFSTAKDSEFSGIYTGEKLYLTETGWVEIKRTGHWSQWQGANDYWTVDGNFADNKEFDASGGGIRWMSDAEVASEYEIKDLAEQLSKTLAELATKIPARMNRKKALAESLRAATSQIQK